MSQYNLRNRAVKRLMKEAEELRHATEEYHAQPVEDNLFEWHFTLRGPPNTDYDGGIYHGRITLPPDYPMKPPSIILLTPNGRFEVNKKICLSISGHHPETWQPSWSIRTALLAIIGFMPTHGNGAIGSLDYSRDERQVLARRSQNWHCLECGNIKDIFCKKSYTLEDKVPSKESLTDIKAHQNESVKEIPKTTPEVSSESNIPTNEDGSTLIHRHRSDLPENALSQIQEENTEASAENTQANAENLNSSFLTYAIYVIVTIILFLCLRRLLSL